MDAANLLKPALARGKLRFLGATTLYEYQMHIEKDPALARQTHSPPQTTSQPNLRRGGAPGCRAGAGRGPRRKLVSSNSVQRPLPGRSTPELDKRGWLMRSGGLLQTS